MPKAIMHKKHDFQIKKGWCELNTLSLTLIYDVDDKNDSYNRDFVP